ncbi:AfsR/SARP family transcriptional regulator [Nonomuraea sp. NPDC023979]|uniref:AfsR/SARP family transcriptional regulator n=1 Tax=Nonomuraea sp. NPDC023979 TaxID=3154796 RepID=UPI0033D07A07
MPDTQGDRLEIAGRIGPVEFRVLGAVEVLKSGARVNLGGAREQTLLGALLLHANEPVSVGYLVESVWDRPLASPETNLRSYVSRLRRRLDAVPHGGDRLLTRSGGYLLVVQPGELDADVFERLLDEAERALAADELSRAVTALRQAVDLWRGAPMQGGRAGPALCSELTRLTERRLWALERYYHTRIRLGEHAAASNDLHRLVAHHPLHEELWALLIVALYRSGRRAEALAAYTRVRNRLADELGIAPGPRLRQLHAAVLHDDPALAPRRPADDLAELKPLPT